MRNLPEQPPAKLAPALTKEAAIRLLQKAKRGPPSSRVSNSSFRVDATAGFSETLAGNVIQTTPQRKSHRSAVVFGVDIGSGYFRCDAEPAELYGSLGQFHHYYLDVALCLRRCFGRLAGHSVGANAYRRLGWIIAELLAWVPRFFDTPNYHILEMAALMQTFLLAGARRRFWAWLLVLLLDFLFRNFYLEQVEPAYEGFRRFLSNFIPPTLILEFGYAYLLAEISALGAVTAFLMPPLNRTPNEKS